MTTAQHPTHPAAAPTWMRPFSFECYLLRGTTYQAAISLSEPYGYLLSIETLDGAPKLTPNGMIDIGIHHDFKNLPALQSLGRELLNQYEAALQTILLA